MKIGLIGAGRIGENAARQFLKVGHSVALSNSRGPDTLTALVTKLGDGARAVTVEEAAQFGDIAMEAIPFKHVESLPADALSGQILISASNYYPDRDGDMPLGELTHTEYVAKHVPAATVVKAFNTIYFEHLRNRADRDADLENRRVIPIAGDEPEAKETVASLIEQIGFAPLDLGPLREGGRHMEPAQPIYNESITRSEARELIDS